MENVHAKFILDFTTPLAEKTDKKIPLRTSACIHMTLIARVCPILQYCSKAKA